MQEGHFIFFDVVTSDGTRVDPDESNTIALHTGVSFSVRLRDMPPGCNGGLAYFTYNGSMFHPHEYAMVREGRILVFAKAVVNTPEAEAYLHEYTMYVQGTSPAPVDKKDPVHDDAIDFFLQEDLGDDATHAFRSHRLKEGVPLVLKSGTQFKVYARTLVYGSEAYLSRFEYNKQQRSIGECTVADGQHQLMVHGYRRLATACADVIYTKRAFTIIGQPPLSEETSTTKMADAKGSRNAAYYGFGFTLVTSTGECHKLFEEEPVTLPSGTVFEVHVTASAPQDVASINDYKYEGPFQSHMCTAVDGKKTLTVYAQRKHDGGWCQHYEATFIIIGEPNVAAKANARQYAVGLLGDTRNPVGNNWLISQGWALTLFEGDKFYLQSTVPGEIGRDLESFEYAGESHLQSSVVRRGRHVVTCGGYNSQIEFTIVGQHSPPKIGKTPPLSEENSTKMADTKEGSSSKWFDLFVETRDDHDNLLNKYRVVDGRVEVPAGERFRFVVLSYVDRQGADAPSFVYRNEVWKSKHIYMPRVFREPAIAAVAVAALHPDGSVKTFERVEVNIVPILRDSGVAAVPEDKADAKEGSSYDLFVETCDDDPVCYPVGNDGRVEVPAGTRFRFVATSNVDGWHTHVSSFKYHGKEMRSRAHRVSNIVTDEAQTARVYVVATKKDDKSKTKQEKTNVTIIPILNDRSAASGAPVADVEVAPPLGKDVERKRASITMSLFEEKEVLEQLVFYSPREDDFAYDSDARTVVIPPGSKFRVGTACSDHKIHWCMYEDLRAVEFVATLEPAVLKIRVGLANVRPYTVEVQVIPCATTTEYDGIILTGPGKKDDKSAASGALVDQKLPFKRDPAEQLVFSSPDGDFAYYAKQKVVFIAPAQQFQVFSTCSDYRIVECTYAGRARAYDKRDLLRSNAYAMSLDIGVENNGMVHIVRVTVVPILENGDIPSCSDSTTTHSVPVCADAEGVQGKRFIPPWNDKERACEECFLTRVIDPRGWKATTGSDACNYTPMRVWLERADDDDMPFAENEEGDYLVPYGTKVVAKTDRGMIDQVQAGGVSHYDRPFTFSPIVQCPSWNVYVKVVFGGLASSCLFTFRLRPAEPDEELKVIWEQNRVQDAIRNTTQTLNDARESLEKTWEKIQAAQDKLTELKVEQAKLESK